MRVTRLHILLLLIGLVCATFALIAWWNTKHEEQERLALARARAQKTIQEKVVEQTEGVQKQETDAMDHLRQSAIESVAVVGESYQRLLKQYGDIPAIGVPLRTAKQAISENQWDVAMASSQEAWKALKTFKSQEQTVLTTYQVKRGDTLWKISKSFSPVHQGPGWVAIWKANKEQIDDFDHVKAGLSLTIPQERSDYVTRYWKPRPAVD